MCAHVRSPVRAYKAFSGVLAAVCPGDRLIAKAASLPLEGDEIKYN